MLKNSKLSAGVRKKRQIYMYLRLLQVKARGRGSEYYDHCAKCRLQENISNYELCNHVLEGQSTGLGIPISTVYLLPYAST